jgi:hypothetical protein
MWKNSQGFPNKKPFDIGTEARRVARDKAAPPPSTRKIGDKRDKPPKHKKPLQEE